jgi:hypothetical protein
MCICECAYVNVHVGLDAYGYAVGLVLFCAGQEERADYCDAAEGDAREL